MGTMFPFFVVALIVSVIGVGLMTILNGLIPDEKGSTKAIHRPAFWVVTTVLTLFSTGFLTLAYWKGSLGIYGPFPFLLEILLLPLISGVIVLLFNGIPVSILGSLLAGLGATGMWFFGQSDFMNAHEKAQLAKVEIVEEVSSALDPVDQRQMNLVTERMARTRLDGALTKITLPDGAMMGSRYKIGDLTKCAIRGEYYWVAPLEFSGWRTWRKVKTSPGFLRMSAKNPYAEPEAVTETSDGSPLVLRYLESACWEFDAKRHLRLHEGFLGKILADWTLEPDDQDRPFYTVTILKRHFGWTGYTVEGVATLDVQTGDVETYSVENAPPWIERIQPIDVISANLASWGRYEKMGWWETWKSKEAFVKVRTSECNIVETSDGRTVYFNGWTSVNSAEHGLIGFSLTDSRTGQTRFYSTNGGYDSNRARTVAATLWTIEGYVPSDDMTVLNLYGEITYVISMEKDDVFSGVSLMMLRNDMVSARGATPDEALRSYRAKLSTSGMELATPSGSAGSLVKLQGRVARVGASILLPQSGTQLFPFMLDSIPGPFYSPSHGSTWESAFLGTGQRVEVSYSDVGDSMRVVETFDILDF